MHFNHVINHCVKRIIVPFMFLIGTEVANAIDIQAIFKRHAENCKYEQNENQKTFLANLFSLNFPINAFGTQAIEHEKS